MTQQPQPLWTDDIRILWEHPLDFFPIHPSHVDPASRANAIVRFVLYSSVILTIYKKNLLPLLYGSGLILLVTFLHSRRQRSAFRGRSFRARQCRLPTKNNPYMNTPTVDMGHTDLKPCLDKLHETDRYANLDTVKNVDDILQEPIENRQFFTLPGGGGPPDFSLLSESLGKDLSKGRPCFQ